MTDAMTIGNKTIEVCHAKWPSFQNVHRLVANNEMPSPNQMLALEKLDGSNLGVEIDLTGGLIALHGRRCLLWQNGDGGDAFDRKYGSVPGTLEPLRDYIPKLTKLAKTILSSQQATTSSTVIYGEWFQDKNGVSASPGWYPFGYSLRQEGNTFYRTMTIDLYQTFLDHCLQPPKILYSGGTLEDAVDALTPLMSAPPSEHFEGVFFTRATVSGVRGACKWKTAQFEEQPKWILDNVIDELQPMVSKLELVFFQKIRSSPVPKKKRSKKEMPTNQISQLQLAFNSVMSKSSIPIEDIRELDKEGKISQMKRLNTEVFEDIQSQFIAVGEDVPKVMKKAIGKYISSQVMKY